MTTQQQMSPQQYQDLMADFLTNLENLKYTPRNPQTGQFMPQQPHPMIEQFEQLLANRQQGQGTAAQQRNRFHSGHFGNVGGSVMYASGSTLSELGLEGGKDASRMASVVRMAGSLGMAVDLLGMAATPTAVALTGATIGVTMLGLAAAKFTQYSDKISQIQDTFGLSAGRGGEGLRGLQGNLGIQTAALADLQVANARDLGTFEELTPSERGTYRALSQRMAAITGTPGEKDTRTDAIDIFAQLDAIRQGDMVASDALIQRITRSGRIRSPEHRARIVDAVRTGDPVALSSALSVGFGADPIEAVSKPKTAREIFRDTALAYYEQYGERVSREAVYNFMDRENVQLNAWDKTRMEIGLFGGRVLGNNELSLQSFFDSNDVTWGRRDQQRFDQLLEETHRIAVATEESNSKISGGGWNAP